MIIVDLMQHSMQCMADLPTADLSTWSQAGVDLASNLGVNLGATVSSHLHSALTHLDQDLILGAKQLETDSFKGFRAAMDYFIKSGQIWALGIGLVVGYIFKSFTSYG